MSIPLEVESLTAKSHGLSDLLLRRLVARMLVQNGDLARAVTGVLLGVELIGRSSLAREAVMGDELLEHARRGAVSSAVHGLDEREERDPFERASVLAA